MDAPRIDDNVPEYRRSHTPGDLKLVRALCTLGLLDATEAKAHVTLVDMASEDPSANEGKSKAAAAIIALKHPALLILHLSSLDHEQHEYGRFAGSSAAVVLARRDDPALAAKVKARLDRLAADPASGIAQVISRSDIQARGSNPDADFFADARIDYEFETRCAGRSSYRER
ncbi:MAG: alkaline phosphatase family protein [Rhodospirillales bacterium]|nr:alkaline phosphatase family protein [Rhodospirillales bacterium]